MTGPAGFDQLASLVSVSSTTDGSPLVATYRITAPGGAWGTANAGTYTATMQANQVSDTHNNFVAAGTLGSIHIDSTDTTPPTAVADPTSIVIGTSTATFSVTYSDPDDVILWSSIDGNDIRMTGPAGFDQLASLVSVNSTTDGSPLVATYQITAPGGAWGTANAGTYTATMQANQVSDTHNNFVAAGTLGSFTVGSSRIPEDFDGNGLSDVLLHNQASGEVGAWLLQTGGAANVWKSMGVAPANTWKVVGTGDFDGNGLSDVLLHNQTSGDVGAWLLQTGGAPNVWKSMGVAPANAWKVVGTGDFDGNGLSDVLLHNQTSGDVGAWLLQTGGAPNGWKTMGTAPANTWKVVGNRRFRRQRPVRRPAAQPIQRRSGHLAITDRRRAERLEDHGDCAG